MPNPLLTRGISPNNTLPGSNWKDLRVGAIRPGQTFIVGSSFPRNIAKFGQATINLGVMIPLNLTFQDIAATSTVAIYITVQYWVINSASSRFGRWNIDFDPAFTVGSPSTLYDQKDPKLQKAFVLVPNSGDNFFSTSIELLNRRTNNGSVEISDASELLLEPGYFVVNPYYAFYDSRDAKGVGVTNDNIYNLQALSIFALVTTPTYIT